MKINFKSIKKNLLNFFNYNNSKVSCPYGKDTSKLMKGEEIPNKHLRGTIDHKARIERAEKYYYAHPEIYPGAKT